MERNPDAIFWIALSLALGVVLLAALLAPRGGEEVRWGDSHPPQEARVAHEEAPEGSSGQPAPEGSDSSGQLAPEGYSAQPAQEDYSAPGSLAPTDTVTAPTESVPTDTAPTDTVPTDTIAPAPLEDSSSGQPPPRVTSCPQDKDRPGVICDKVPSQF